MADVPLGAKVEFTGVSDGDFHKVINQDMTGYVLKSYLTGVKWYEQKPTFHKEKGGLSIKVRELI